MKLLEDLFENNEKWVATKLIEDPSFFDKLCKIQTPKFLWIGCSDSRVPANQITGTQPGEMFVHRNIANMVLHTDFNALSVIEYAVNFLHVEHIIVCGHYGCGGVKAAMSNDQHGMVDNWLRTIKDVYRLHTNELDKLGYEQKLSRLTELNVIENAYNVCKTTIVQNAWNDGKELAIHAWIYDLHNGMLKDLGVTSDNNDAMHDVYQFDDEH